MTYIGGTRLRSWEGLLANIGFSLELCAPATKSWSNLDALQVVGWLADENSRRTLR